MRPFRASASAWRPPAPQADILPARITTQEEAEVLIALDAVVEKADQEWRSYLIATVRDFVVWGLSPVGRVDRPKRSGW